MGSLFAPKAPKPTILPPATAPAPLPDDQAMLAAKKKQIAAQQQRGGRMSTILTDTGDEKLG